VMIMQILWRTLWERAAGRRRRPGTRLDAH
jgi:hypothetical protein